MKRLHTREQFDVFMSQLKATNTNLGFYCDFDKIRQNVSEVEIKLNTLNYLIGKKDIPQAVRTLWAINNTCFDILHILIAVHEGGKLTTNRANEVKRLDDFFDTPDHVIEFLQDTGLEEIFKNQDVKNLVDYVFGVETGLDTNSRKNRSGIIMENKVAQMLHNEGINYEMQVSSTLYNELNVLGEDTKVFDFVVETPQTTYLIEVNFYSGGGSKLNEVARAYKELSPVINSVPGFEFVWITDGKGWFSARNKLEDAFYMIKNVYNITTLPDFIKKVTSELR